MPRYIIEAEHDPTPEACLRALDAFMYAGSHYLTHADWGCKDGDHTAWMVIEADDDVTARHMVPPVIRRSARLVKLSKFTPQEIKELHLKYDQKVGP